MVHPISVARAVKIGQRVLLLAAAIPIDLTAYASIMVDLIAGAHSVI